MNQRIQKYLRCQMQKDQGDSKLQSVTMATHYYLLLYQVLHISSQTDTLPLCKFQIIILNCRLNIIYKDVPQIPNFSFHLSLPQPIRYFLPNLALLLYCWSQSQLVARSSKPEICPSSLSLSVSPCLLLSHSHSLCLCLSLFLSLFFLLSSQSSNLSSYILLDSNLFCPPQKLLP